MESDNPIAEERQEAFALTPKSVPQELKTHRPAKDAGYLDWLRLVVLKTNIQRRCCADQNKLPQ